MSSTDKLRGLKRLLLRQRSDPGSSDLAARRLRAMYLPLESRGKERNESLAEFLAQVTLFEGLGRGDRLRLARVLHERDFADGEYICKEHAPGAALFILRRGIVEIVSGEGAGEVPLALLEPPASFEEAGALGVGVRRWFSVRARGPVSLLALGRSDLDALIGSFPELANKVLVRMAGMLAVRLQMRIDAEALGSAGASEEVEP